MLISGVSAIADRKHSLIGGRKSGSSNPQKKNLLSPQKTPRTPKKNLLSPQKQTLMTPKRDEIGSISPLIIFYFSILMILIFLISNVASVYIARRELTNRVEAGLAIAAQELDEFRYYYGSPLTDYLAEDAMRDRTLRVPIDCSESRVTFQRFIKYGSNPSALEIEFECDGFEIGAVVAEVHELPFQLRVLGFTQFKNRVSAATSSYLLNS